jgi:hypothetical protein
MESRQTKHYFEGELLMARITQREKKRKQEAQNRAKAVEYALKHGNKSEAARLYLVSLASIKRWCKRYDGIPKARSVCCLINR